MDPLNNVQTYLKQVLSESEYEGLRRLILMRSPVASLSRAWGAYSKGEFNYTARKSAAPSWQKLKNFKPGFGLIMKTGEVFDVIDIDKKNGKNGFALYDSLKHLINNEVARVETPSGGLHIYVPATGLASIHLDEGIDYQGVNSLVFIPGTTRPKYGDAQYRWLSLPEIKNSYANTEFPDALLQTKVASSVLKSKNDFPVRSTSDLFGGWGILNHAINKVVSADPQTRHNTLFDMSFYCGSIAKDWDTQTKIEIALIDACRRSGYMAEHGIPEVVRTIRDGLRYGMQASESEK